MPWLLCLAAYIWPLAQVHKPNRSAARQFATLHSFRFFGLVFILPGVVGANLPVGFAPFAAYGDFATGSAGHAGASDSARLRPLFWLFVVAFNVVGTVDILVDYYHGNQLGLAPLAGELGATYAIPIIYVPLLMITHVDTHSILLMRPQSQAARALAG